MLYTPNLKLKMNRVGENNHHELIRERRSLKSFKAYFESKTNIQTNVCLGKQVLLLNLHYEEEYLAIKINALYDVQLLIPNP